MAKYSLLLDLKVSRLLPAPQSATVGIGFFRVSCPALAGAVVSDQTFEVLIGTTVTRDLPCSTVVLRTDRPVTVVLTKGQTTQQLVVDQLLALTMALDSIAITYPAEEGAELSSVARVSLIQS